MQEEVNTATGGVTRGTNVISNLEPVGRDKYWYGRALNVRKQVRGLVDSYLRPFRLLHCLSCKVAGMNARQLVVGSSVSVGDGECWDGSSYNKRRDGLQASPHGRGPLFRASEIGYS